MNVSLLKLICSFLLLTFLSINSFAEFKKDKSIEERKKELLELKGKVEEIKKEDGYKSQLDTTEKNIDAFISMLETEKSIKQNDETFQKLIKDGKLAFFEDFYKVVPENLKYKIPTVKNNSYTEFCNFWRDHDWPGFNTKEFGILEKIEKFKKVSTEEVKQIRDKLKKQKAVYLKAMHILKDRPFILTPEETIGISDDLGSLRSMAKYLTNSALIKFREGKKEVAIKLVNEAHSLALLLEKRKGSPIDLLISNAMKGIARYRATWILSQRSLSEKQIFSLQSLTEKSNVLSSWENAIKYELYFCARIAFGNPFQEILNVEFSAKELEEAKEEIKKLAPEMTKEKVELKKLIDDSLAIKNVKNLNKTYLKYSSNVLSLLYEDLSHFPAIKAVKVKSYVEELIKIHDNFFLKLLVSNLIVHNIYISKNAYNQNSATAIKVIIAFRLHEIRRHGPPKNLQALVDAGLLKEIPLDAWSGKTLKLDPQKRTINFEHIYKDQIKEINF